MTSDDPTYTSAIRLNAKKYRYEVRHAGNGGVAIFFEKGDLAAAFSTAKDACDWMEERLEDFQREIEVAA